MSNKSAESQEQQKGAFFNKFANGAMNVAGNGAETVRQSAKKVYQAFGGECGEVFEGNLINANGAYKLPDPEIDEREFREINLLAQQYERLTSPSPLAEAGKQIGEIAPRPVKALASKAGDVARETLNGLTEQEFMAKAIKAAAEGFEELEKEAAKASVSKEYVLSCVNEGKQEQRVTSLSEICFLRAYDVAAISEKERLHHMGAALIEGGGLGALGFWGLPANLALSMLIYFRAVQAVAMFYGYDVKDDPSELVIASEVFQSALSPNTKVDSASEYIRKVLIYAESAAIKQAAKKGWAAMVEQGGAALAMAQIRALANAAARKAVENGGKKALEAGIFTKALTQIGQKLTLKSVGKLVPIIGAGFGALFDTAQMKRVLDFANLFYHKRFIIEKSERMHNLAQKDVGESESIYHLNVIEEENREDPDELEKESL